MYIHGAHSSALSFKYVNIALPEHKALYLNYSVDTPFIDNEKEFWNLIHNEFKGEPCDIIAHSMGGLYAARIAKKCDCVQRVVTISTPYGGSKFVDYLRLLAPQYQLFKDVRCSSPVIKSFTGYTSEKPFLQIVTTGGGNPLMGEQNDGTVTIRSQKSIGVDMVELDLNHFEVLLSDVAINVIKNHLYA